MDDLAGGGSATGARSDPVLAEKPGGRHLAIEAEDE